MSDTGWTPGPWSWIGFGPGDGSFSHLSVGTSGDRKYGGGIAEILLRAEWQKRDALANAHLISAAPDLYEALYGFQHVLAAHLAADDLAEIDTVLAKARGES